jgi:hypothetical protein
MTFSEYPGPRYGGGRSNAVRVALRRRNGALLLMVSIGGDLVGRYGFAERDRVRVLFGSGEDFGRILVAECEGKKGTGFLLLRRSRGPSLSAFVSTLPAGTLGDADGFRHRFPLVQRAAVACGHRGTERGLVVTLPADWFEAVDPEARAMRAATRREIEAMDERDRLRREDGPPPGWGRAA